MGFGTLKVVAVEQAGDTLTALFNNGRTVAYSISMLDSEFEQIETAIREEAVAQEPSRERKRQRAKPPRSKRPASETRSAWSLSSRKAS